MKYSFGFIVAATAVVATTAGRRDSYTRIPRTFSSSIQKSQSGKNHHGEMKTKTTTTISSFVANLPRCGDYSSSWQDDYQDDQGRGYNDYGSSSSQQNDQYYDDYYNRDNDRYGDGYDDRGGYYDDIDDRGSSKSSSSPLSSIPVPNIVKNGDRKIGLALLGLGTVFTVLGMSLFFNKALMRLGNLMFIGRFSCTHD